MVWNSLVSTLMPWISRSIDPKPPAPPASRNGLRKEPLPPRTDACNGNDRAGKPCSEPHIHYCRLNGRLYCRRHCVHGGGA